MEKSKWILIYGLDLTIKKFLYSWNKIPQSIKSNWLKLLLTGAILLILVVLILVYSVKYFIKVNGNDFELNILKAIVANLPPFFGTAEFISTPGNAIFIIPVSIAAAITAIWINKPLNALSILASAYGIKLFVLFGWLIWDRERPQIVREGLFNPPLHSFPSGHVALVISFYGLFTYFWINSANLKTEKITAAILYLLLVILVIISRLGMGMHWLSDVLAGSLIGSVWLAYLIFILKKAEKSNY